MPPCCRVGLRRPCKRRCARDVRAPAHETLLAARAHQQRLRRRCYKEGRQLYQASLLDELLQTLHQASHMTVEQVAAGFFALEIQEI